MQLWDCHLFGKEKSSRLLLGMRSFACAGENGTGSDEQEAGALFLGMLKGPKGYRVFPGTIVQFLLRSLQDSQGCPQSSWSVCRFSPHTGSIESGLLFQALNSSTSSSGKLGNEAWCDLQHIKSPMPSRDSCLPVCIFFFFHFQETALKEPEATSKHFRGYVFTWSILIPWKMVFSISLVTEGQQGRRREKKSLRRLPHTQQCHLKCTSESAPSWVNESWSHIFPVGSQCWCMALVFLKRVSLHRQESVWLCCVARLIFCKIWTCSLYGGLPFNCLLDVYSSVFHNRAPAVWELRMGFLLAEKGLCGRYFLGSLLVDPTLLFPLRVVRLSTGLGAELGIRPSLSPG